MTNPANEGFDSPRVVKALKRQHRTNQFRAVGALLFGALFGFVALVIVVGSARHGEYSAILLGLFFAAISAYLLYSARNHFRSL